MMLRAACAGGLHDGDGVEALLQVGAHGHGNADRSEHEGDVRLMRESRLVAASAPLVMAGLDSR